MGGAPTEETVLRIAVLVKQIPAPAQLRMEDGRAVRAGVDLEVNAYCRRANAKAVELAGPDGETVVFTMGPPPADDALREMIACGAHRGVHLCDPAFAGSDTLATARALAAAVAAEGPFDLVLAGLNSLDADTGQVPAETAELLGLPFEAGVHHLDLDGREFTARLETDDGYRTVTGRLPAMLSTAERLCDPSKAPPEQREQVPAERIRRVGLAELGLRADQVGAAGSPTSVGAVRHRSADRLGLRAETVSEAVDRLAELGAFASGPAGDSPVVASSPADGGNGSAPASTAVKDSKTAGGAASSPDGDGSDDGSTRPEVWCFFTEPGTGAELLGEGAELARRISGSVTAVAPHSIPDGLGALGADRVLAVASAGEPEEWAGALDAAVGAARPWALLVEGTRTGRVVASIVAARRGWGLTGDAIGLEVGADQRLVAWKPAFGGQLEAPILTSSPVQMATVRPGVLARRRPRSAADPHPTVIEPPAPARIRTESVTRSDDDPGELNRARAVVAVGVGVAPDGYPVIDELRAALGGAAIGATRRVTDRGWLPRSRQIGVTGHSVAPRLLIAVGSSGRFNHTVGIGNAGVLMAINSDPGAEIFDQVDVGLVGEWQQLVPELTAELKARGLASPTPEATASPIEGGEVMETAAGARTR